MSDAIFDQTPQPVKLDWGWRGCAAAAARGEIVVIVDVLRFSTVCAVACSRGICVIPAAMDADLAPLARKHDGQIPANDFARLSPDAYDSLARGTRLVVKSPNGATCATLAAGAPHVLFGAIVNASAVARRIEELMRQRGVAASVIACGERWTGENPDGQLRFAIEDYLGAGSILSRLSINKSAEAIVCENAFRGSQVRLTELLLDSASGRELVDRGLARDVHLAGKVDLHDVVPVFQDGVINSSSE